MVCLSGGSTRRCASTAFVSDEKTCGCHCHPSHTHILFSVHHKVSLSVQLLQRPRCLCQPGTNNERANPTGNLYHERPITTR